ncbi:dihydrofolate reductase [Nocardia sp. BMG51109]|uniref:dihydrofolate reductase n=1 Tax=Nocardia sp. BMG51109 TaxID=1056816 RepID=UPI000466F9A7|nr:dihydrofolate reductase [Nocardia sp. BMG51109]
MSSATTPTGKRTVGLIWAQTRDRVIGAKGTVPWHIPEDLEHFQEVITGHTVIMGRRTWDALPEQARARPEQRNIVVTRDPQWYAAGAERAGSIEEALSLTDPEEVWVIGGGETLRAAMPYATVISLTEVSTDVAGDVYAPEITGEFIMAFTTGVQRSANGRDSYVFRSYARK